MNLKNFVLPLVCSIGLATVVRAADFYIAPSGNDAQLGSREKPFATLEAARDAARKSGGHTNRIVVLPGDYFLAQTFVLDSRDNGLTIESAEQGKAVFYGGKVVTGWRRDGEKFWCADLPGVKEGKWDFRALLVNGRMAERARWPESGTFFHQNEFKVNWLGSVGGWTRPPTVEEMTQLRYDPKDIPAALDGRNAEVRVYHQWSESLVSVVTNDTKNHILTIQRPEKPVGAYGVNKYVIFNTSEGMTKPGQWCLDRPAGRVVYWPLPGEDMTKAKVIAPVMQRIFSIVGTSNRPVEKITLRGLALQVTTVPLEPAGFAASNYDGALVLAWARRCVLEKLEIVNVAGNGVKAQELFDCQIRDCHIHHTGACAIRATGADTFIGRNQLHDIGLICLNGVGIVAKHDKPLPGEKGFHLYRNEIHDGTYCGINATGDGHLIEENLIYRVMLELRDGAAIYGMMQNSIFRGNFVRDLWQPSDAFSAVAYYLDEGSENCVVERNVSVNVIWPTHNHMARNLTLRDNVFIVQTNMVLSFGKSSHCTFAGNTLYVPGRITIHRPVGITLWTNNIVFQGGLTTNGTPQPFKIQDAMPFMPPPNRWSKLATVTRIKNPPNVDGDFAEGEWPVDSFGLNREPSRWQAIGAPAVSYFAYDDQNLYIAIKTVMFDVHALRLGTAWGVDDGVEISLPSDKAAFVLRGFVNGQFQSVTNGGVSAEAVAQLGKQVRYAAKSYGKFKGDWKSGWRCEWAIPLAALGIQPAPGKKLPFNIAVYRAEDGAWHCYEGTLGENWRLNEAATMQLSP